MFRVSLVFPDRHLLHVFVYWIQGLSAAWIFNLHPASGYLIADNVSVIAGSCRIIQTLLLNGCRCEHLISATKENMEWLLMETKLNHLLAVY